MKLTQRPRRTKGKEEKGIQPLSKDNLKKALTKWETLTMEQKENLDNSITSVSFLNETLLDVGNRRKLHKDQPVYRNTPFATL